MLFENLDDMDIGLRYRFGHWFALHLSYFEYKWIWSDWEDALVMKKNAPQRICIEDVLIRCIRLSYFERIKPTIPASFVFCLPENTAPTAKYTRSSNVEGSAVIEVYYIVLTLL